MIKLMYCIYKLFVKDIQKYKKWVKKRFHMDFFNKILKK